MAKRSMSDKLRNIKEGEIIPVEQKITFREGEETPGTSAKIEEEITIGPEVDPDEARPKPTPKKNRRGGQKLQAELEKQKELAEGNKEKYTRLLAEFDNMRARNEKENSQMSDKGAMDALDKIHEDVRFVLSVRFGKGYVLRTDETTFIASLYYGYPRDRRDLTDKSIQPLRYCTDMVAIDVGHMFYTNVDFCRDMKHLKWLIIGDSMCSDISALANCKELYYLEMFSCYVTDFSPLLECRELRHLNICNLQTADSLDVIAQMTWLERLWMSGPYSFRRGDRAYLYSDEFLPDTQKRLSGYDSTGDGWRRHPAYYEMRDIFGAYYLP